MRRGVVNKFNRGEIDKTALMRDDVDHINNTCESMVNFMPQRLGGMMYRMGSVHLGYVDQLSYIVPFLAEGEKSVLLEFSSTRLRLWRSGGWFHTGRDLISAIDSLMYVPNGDFHTDLTGWTDISNTGATVVAAGSLAIFKATSDGVASIWQTIAGAFSSTPITLRFQVTQGSLFAEVGEGGANSGELYRGFLDVGTHYITVTPLTTQPTITLSAKTIYSTRIDAVEIMPAGVFEIPLAETITRVTSIRYAQSADRLWITTSNTRPFIIERRGDQSWSVVRYENINGSFGKINDSVVRLSVDRNDGDAQMTSLIGSGLGGSPFFKPEDVGRLYRIDSGGQQQTITVSNTAGSTPSVRIDGDNRRVSIRVSSDDEAWLEVSDDDSAWSDVRRYSGSTNDTYSDGATNVLKYYRVTFKVASTGSLWITSYAGTQTGVCRTVGYVAPNRMNVIILKPFSFIHNLSYTTDWYVDEWKTGKYPTAVSLYQGRLWFAGRGKLWGTVSDDFNNFDTETGGSDSSIKRSIGFGAVSEVSWLAPTTRLVMGLSTDEITVSTSRDGEVMTPTNIKMTAGSTNGVRDRDVVRMDTDLIYVHRDGRRLMKLSYDGVTDSYFGDDLMKLNPAISLSNIRRFAISRSPETRIYVVLENGTMIILLLDEVEKVAAWSRYETDGDIYDITAFNSGDAEDDVFMLVTRDGVGVLERLSHIGSKTAGRFDASAGAFAPTQVWNLPHLANKTVGIWADYIYRGTKTVASNGDLTMDSGSYGVAIVGLEYEATYKSNKVGRYINESAIGKRKRVVDLHLAMLDYWPAGVQVGHSLDDLQPMPVNEYGRALDPNVLVDEYDEYPFEFNGETEIDPRICIKATAPCVILAMTYGVLHDGDTTDS